MKKLSIVILVLVLIAGVVWFANWIGRPQPGKVKDEALAAGREAESFPAADEDYFHDMDGGAHADAGRSQGP